jgi:hypothetical protein
MDELKISLLTAFVFRRPKAQAQDATMSLLADLYSLSQSRRVRYQLCRHDFQFTVPVGYLQLILPVSSWAFWAGALAQNASEVHVNSPPHHPLMHNFSNYVYHNEGLDKYFGYLNESLKEIVYLH